MGAARVVASSVEAPFALIEAGQLLNSLILNIHCSVAKVAGGAVQPAVRGGATLARREEKGKILGTMIPFATQGSPAGISADPEAGAGRLVRATLPQVKRSP